MNTRNVPDAQTAMCDLAEIIPAIYDVIENATLKARDYFWAQDLVVNNAAYVALVRYHAVLQFQDRGYRPENLPNNGLCLTYGGYKIKIYKLLFKAVPPPGPSRRRQRFYNQNSYPLPAKPRQLTLLASNVLALLTRVMGEEINVIVTWEPTKQWDLHRLTLAAPKKGTYNPSSTLAR